MDLEVARALARQQRALDRLAETVGFLERNAEFGGVDFASSAETITGTAVDLAVTPAGLAARLALPMPGVIPTSITRSGGSHSVLADGTVVFTGVTSIRLDGLFDASTLLYGIDLQATSLADNQYVLGRLVRSGVPITAASYNYSSFGMQGWAGPSVVNATTGIAFWYMSFAAASFMEVRSQHKLWNPGLARVSYLTSVLGARGLSQSSFTGLQDATGDGALACDGLFLYASSGTMSGRVKIKREW